MRNPFVQGGRNIPKPWPGASLSPEEICGRSRSQDPWSHQKNHFDIHVYVNLVGFFFSLKKITIDGPFSSPLLPGASSPVGLSHVDPWIDHPATHYYPHESEGYPRPTHEQRTSGRFAT